ncbi:hypothetical protein [Rathayibacter festucae]|uniref:hypothetical protein n=1 Tax=Rathayibacter festucae TaxID=110937 RepID=UPI002A6B5EE2|nr:hypothetical protein [Rathayibacter festucae]MDY0914974.1 hypothetical protein [Rathayibacter festucae]
MKKHVLPKALATLGLGVALAFSVAVPAEAISRPDCGDRTDFLKFFNGPHCYANKGTASDRLDCQQTVGAGNNNGFFTTNEFGDVTFRRGWGTSYARPQVVSVEHID